MSRRRKEVDVEGSPDGWIGIHIVCTGRRSHERWSFGWVDVSPDGVVEWERLKEDTVSAFTSDDGPGRTHRFRCRRCTRDVPLAHGTLETMARQFAQRRVAGVLDVSALGAATVTK